MPFKFSLGDRVRRNGDGPHGYRYQAVVKDGDEGMVTTSSAGLVGDEMGRPGEFIFVKWDNDTYYVDGGFYSCCLEAIDNAEQFKPEDWS